MNIDDKYVTKRKQKSIQFDADNNTPDNRPAAPTPKRRKPIVRARRTMSMKANLLFPVARFKRYLREDRYASKVSAKSCVYLAAVLEYLTAEVLDIASDVATQHKKSRINPRHLTLGILNDLSLNRLVPNLTIPEGGVLPNIQPFLIAKEAMVKPKATPTSSQQEPEGEDEGEDDNEDYNENTNHNNNINATCIHNIQEPDWD